MKIVNLTPHPVTILDWKEDNIILELPGCDNPPRAREKRETVEIVKDIPVNKLSLGDVENLPKPNEDTIYIVSRIVAEACPERTDLFIPDETVRDENGRIIGCRALAQV